MNDSEVETFLVACLLGRSPADIDVKTMYELRSILRSLNRHTMTFVKTGFARWYVLRCEVAGIEPGTYRLAVAEKALITSLSGSESIIGWPEQRRLFYEKAFRLRPLLRELFPQGAYRLGRPSLDWPDVDEMPGKAIT